jgi:hypothetical protein
MTIGPGGKIMRRRFGSGVPPGAEDNKVTSAEPMNLLTPLDADKIMDDANGKVESAVAITVTHSETGGTTRTKAGEEATREEEVYELAG